MTDPDILDAQAVAALLDCEPRTIADKARAGELPAVKIGRSWLFPRAALMQALNTQALASYTPVKPAAPVHPAHGAIKGIAMPRAPSAGVGRLKTLPVLPVLV